MLTVTDAATKLNLIGVEEARTALALFDRSDDDQLAAFVDRASDVCARHCRRVFAEEGVEETIRLRDYTDGLVLARYPVGEIDSIVENGNTLTEDVDYEVDGDSGIVTRLVDDSECHWPPGKIVVAYTAGYSLPDDAPDGLKQAALQLVKAYFHGIDRDPLVRSESVDGLSSGSYDTQSAGALPHDVRELLGPFRNIRVR